VPSDYIFYGDIQFLACRGIINGFVGGTFQPNANTTRGQFAKIAINGFGLPAFTPTTPSFVDVPANYVFYSFIEAAFNAGAILGLDSSQCASLGTPGRCFGPNQNITRAQVAAIVLRSRQYAVATPASGQTFQDVPRNYFAFAAIETLANRSIILGNTCASGNGLCFRPNDNIRRGELSAVTRRAIQSAP